MDESHLPPRESSTATASGLGKQANFWWQYHLVWAELKEIPPQLARTDAPVSGWIPLTKLSDVQGTLQAAICRSKKILSGGMQGQHS